MRLGGWALPQAKEGNCSSASLLTANLAPEIRASQAEALVGSGFSFLSDREVLLKREALGQTSPGSRVEDDAIRAFTPTTWLVVK
jgi:hypothetical protein